MKVKVKVKSLRGVRLFVTPWTVAHLAPPSMGFSRQEYWSGLPFPSPGDLPNPGIKPRSPALQADTLTSEPPGTVWITTNWKILQEMGIPDHVTFLLRNLYADQEATVRTGHVTTDWFQIGKGVSQDCILSPYLFNLYAVYIMWNAGLDEAQAGIKIARRNIDNFRYTDAAAAKLLQSCPTLCDSIDGSPPGSPVPGILQARTLEWVAISFSDGKKRRRTKEPLNESEEESEKVGLNFNIQKIKIIASGPITSCQIDVETVETMTDFIYFFWWGGSKITADSDCSHEIKRHLLLGRKGMTNLDSILKSRDITLPTKVCLVKAMIFPVVMYGCESWTIKKPEHQRTDAFELWC